MTRHRLLQKRRTVTIGRGTFKLILSHSLLPDLELLPLQSLLSLSHVDGLALPMKLRHFIFTFALRSNWMAEENLAYVSRAFTLGAGTRLVRRIERALQILHLHPQVLLLTLQVGQLYLE